MFMFLLRMITCGSTAEDQMSTVHGIHGFFSISTVKGILLIVESSGNLTVLPADVRVEAVFVLGDVRALRTLELHASHHMQVLHVAGDASLGHHLVARVAHETPISLGDIFVDERILN